MFVLICTRFDIGDLGEHMIKRCARNAFPTNSNSHTRTHTHTHVYTGDGHIIKFVLDGTTQRAHISNKFVRTAEFTAEEKVSSEIE